MFICLILSVPLRCNKELEGGVKWEENWGHIFNPEVMHEGKHRPIEVRIAELREELDRYYMPFTMLFFTFLFFLGGEGNF